MILQRMMVLETMVMSECQTCLGAVEFFLLGRGIGSFMDKDGTCVPFFDGGGTRESADELGDVVCVVW